MSFTSGNDTNILQSTDTAVVGAGLGDDIYIVSEATISANQTITISDTDGVNTIQLIEGLDIISSMFANDAVQLTLSNGAVITVLGASDFLFDVGGNALLGITGTVQDFATFASDTLGATIPAADEEPVQGGGTTIGSGVVIPPDEETTPGNLFTLTDETTEVISQPDTITTTKVYWGYNPNGVIDTSDDSEENPSDGGIPVEDLLDFLTTITGLDLAELGLIDDDGSGPFDNVTNLELELEGGVSDNDSSTGELTITFADGLFTNAEVQLGEAYFDFLNNLLFDSEGNSRLYEKTFSVSTGTSHEVEVPSDDPIVLTPTENNGGTIEPGFTDENNDTIVAGRLELIHQAYIDGGEGDNTLEIDAKGVYAQPLALLNIQDVQIENLPNIYTTVDGYDGTQIIGSNYPGFNDSDIGSYINSIIDLSRAIDIETLTITEGDFTGFVINDSPGSLTVAGIRNGAETTLDGGFTQDVTLHYGEIQGDGVDLVFSNLDMENCASLTVAQNSDTLNIESTGGGNYLEDAYLGGQLSELNISGDAHLFIEGDLGASFHDESPVTIDASQNTGGVNLNLTGSQNVTFLGTEADDRFSVTTADSDAYPINDESVNIIGGEGNNYYEVTGAETVTITNGDGDNNYEINDTTSLLAVNQLSITTGNGDNHFEVDGVAEADLTAGDGNNRFDILTDSSYDYLGVNGPDFAPVLTIEAGNGENVINVGNQDYYSLAAEVNITVGDGGNTMFVQSETINVTAGAGDDTLILVNGDNSVETFEEYTALINIDLGGGQNSLQLGVDDDQDGITDDLGITALKGSSITGENITLFVKVTSDLRAASLTGITQVILDDNSDASPLTLTADQFAAIGAENFSVEGSDFGAKAFVELIVTETTSLTDLGVEDLPLSIDLKLVVMDGVTLTMTAEQLHTYIANDGVIQGQPDVNDIAPGKIIVTDAGLSFDAFEVDGDDANQGDLGSVGTDFGDNNVEVIRDLNGYERPESTPNSDTMVIDSDVTPDVSGFGDSDTQLKTLIIEGAADINFTGDIDLGDNFTVDMSDLGGNATDLTLTQFEDITAADAYAGWGKITGNGTAENPLRINVEVSDGATVGNADFGVTNGGFKSSGVQTYVVTDILDEEGNPNSQATEDSATIVVCDATQDLETLGLQNNRNSTVTFEQVNWGTTILLEGDGYANASDQEKNLGNPDLSEIGAVVVNFFESGANAVVNINNQGVELGMDEDTEDGYETDGERILDVAGITINDADRLVINVADGDAEIHNVSAPDVERVFVNGVEDVIMHLGEGAFSAGVKSIDGANVVGEFVLDLVGAHDYSATVLTEIDEVVLSEAYLTLSADQILDIELENFSTSTDDVADSYLDVVGLADQVIDLSVIGFNVANVRDVYTADVAGTIILNEATHLGGADQLVIVAETSDTDLQMTADQFHQICGYVDADTDQSPMICGHGDFYEATLILTDIAEDEVIDLGFVDQDGVGNNDVSVIIQVADIVVTDDFEISNGSVSMEVAGTVDLTAGAVDAVEAVSLAENAVLTMTADQITQITIVDDNSDGVADNWSALAGTTLNVTDLSTQALDLDAIAAAGITIGTVTIADTDGDIEIDAATTFGNAAEIVTPMDADGIEATTVSMTVAQFMTSAGIITGESQIYLTDLINNVDTDADYVADTAEYDLSGIAHAATITLGESTVTLSDTADLGDFDILLGNGQMIQFAEQSQASGTTVTEISGTTAIAWLFDAIAAQIDTSNYDGDINTLYINEDLVDGQNEEDLWNTLPSTIAVEKVNNADIPDVLISFDRTNTFEALTAINGVSYDDQAEFQTIENLTINLEGNTNIGDVGIGDTVLDPDATTLFNALVINSYEDRTTLDDDTGFNFQPNKVGDISINAGSLDELVNVTLNTYADADGDLSTADGGFRDVENVAGAEAERDGLALEVGTITFSAEEAQTAFLTLTGDENITIDAVNISDAEITLLDIDASNFTGNLEIASIGPVDGINAFDHIFVIDGHTAVADDMDDAGNNLLVVAGGDNDLTAADDGGFDVDAVHVTQNGTLTLTAAQVNVIGEADFSVAAGVSVTLNVTEVPDGSAIDLNVVRDAGFDIGTVSTADADVTLADNATLGGADQVLVVLDDNDRTFTLTAEQYTQISGTIEESDIDLVTVATPNVAHIVITDLEDLATTVYNTAIGSGSAQDYDTTQIDLTTVNTTGTHRIQINDAGDAGDVTLHPLADLGDFTVVLDSQGTALNDLAGQNVRFFTAVQAERAIDVINDDGPTDNATNVIWLFDAITGTAVAGKVNTADYDAELGRVWMLDVLVDGENVEDLYTDLAESVIVRVANSADLDTLLPGTTGFDRIVEIESFTELPAGLTFNDIDELNDTPYNFVENLTLTLGGAVSMGNLALDNIIAEPLSNDDEFNLLTINSLLANTDTHYLLPEDFDTLVNPLPSELGNATAQVNYIGDIMGDGAYPGTGTARLELEAVTVNTGNGTPGNVNEGVALDIQTIYFSEETGETSVAQFTADGANDVTVKSLDTTDAEITGLNVDNNLAATLAITGGSPAAAVANTETLVVDTVGGAVTNFGSDDADGVGVYAGVYGPDLSTITVTGAGETNLGTIAQIDGVVVAGTGFVLNASGATGIVTATMGIANVDGTDKAPALAADEAWTFNFAGADTASNLTITEDVAIGAGDLAFTMGNAELTIEGNQDWTAATGITYTNAAGTIVLSNDATLQMTDEQWNASGMVPADFIDPEEGTPGDTVLHVTAALLADIGTDLTLVRGYDAYEIDNGLSVTLREDQADVATVDDGTGTFGAPGALGDADVTVFVQETGFGDNDITDLTGVAALVIETDATDADPDPLVDDFGYEVTMTVEQADSLVGSITKNNNFVVAEAGDTGADGTQVDLTDPAGDGSVAAYDLSEVDFLEVTDDDGSIINLVQFNAIGGAAGLRGDGSSPVTLIGNGDFSAEDLTGITNFILDGDATLTLDQVNAIAAAGGTITMEDPADTHTLSITDVELADPNTATTWNDNDDIVEANIDGFINVDSTIDIDLTHVTVDTVNATMSTTTIDPADGVTVIDGQFEVTGDLNGATLSLTGDGTVDMDVTVANGETIVGTAATVNLTDAAAADDDLNGTAINLTGIAAAIAGTYTMSENAVLEPTTDLGDFIVDTTATPFNLTGTAVQIDGLSVIGDGNVTVTDLGSDAVDLSSVTATGTLLAELLNDAVTPTTSITLDAATDLGGFDVDVKGTVIDFSLSAAQADGVTVTETGGTLDDLVVTAFEDALDADLTGIDDTTWDTDVQLDSTGNVVIAAGADLSGLNGGTALVAEDQVTITGTGTVTIADETAVGADDGADVDTTSFVVTADATLLSDFAQADTDSTVTIANVSGAGTLQVIVDDSGTYTITEDVRYTEIIINGADDNVEVDGFNNSQNDAFFIYNPGVDDLIGRHTLDLNESLVATAGTGANFEQGTTGVIGLDTGLYVYDGNNVGGSTEADIEDLFDGTTSALQFNSPFDDLYLAASDGANTFVWLIENDGITSTFFEGSDDATLVVILSGLPDATQLDVNNFVDFS